MGRSELILGFGINDLPTDEGVTYDVEILLPSGELVIKKRIHRYYQAWMDVMKRCFDKGYKIKYPAYVECTMSVEWASLQNWKDWFLSENWEGRYVDKDIIEFGNKEYSPEKCILVTRDMNNFFTGSAKTRGELPLGVYLKKGNKYKKYAAGISGYGIKSNYLGYYYDPMEAHRAWQKKKIEIGHWLAEKEDVAKVKDAFLARLSLIEQDYLHHKETLNI